MVDFLDRRLEDVWLDDLFPLLGHNDLLRLRRVCSQTKELATRFLWTSGNQASCEWTGFEGIPNGELPPPSQLSLILDDEAEPFYENEHLVDFLRTSGKYITHLSITSITIPFVSAKEIECFNCLTNLKSLSVFYVKTRGIAEFEKKMKMEGSCLFPPGFKKIKNLKLAKTDKMNLAWRFISEMGENLETLSAPNLLYWNIRPDSVDASFRRFLERQGNMKYFDCENFKLSSDPMERVRVFQACFRNGIKLRNVDAFDLRCILVEMGTGQIDATEVMDPITGELVYRVDYQRNSFIGSVIQSLVNLEESVFLMEMPFLEELRIDDLDDVTFRIWRRHGYPSWPSLQKLTVTMDSMDPHVGGEILDNMLHFLWGQNERPKMEELCLEHVGFRGGPIVNPRDIGRSFANLKKLTIEDCDASNNFFAALWAGLPMLEYVHLVSCCRLGNNAFIGNANVRRGQRPVFMNLQRLKHLKIDNAGATKINDNLFEVVIRNLKLNSLELTSVGKIRHRITVEGLKTLLTGVFAESIEKLKLCELKLHGVSAEKMLELESLFRSSQMI